MPIVRTAFAALAAVLLSSACNSKQKINSAQNIRAADTASEIFQLPDDTLNLQKLSGDFVTYSVQRFIVPKSKTKIVTGKKGLKVTVSYDVLEKADGTTVDGPIEVRMVELTNSNDLFKANAVTVSNGRLLVSGGSYFLEMFCNGKKLQVKKGKRLNVDFPVLNDSEMELFYGERDTSGNMNWLTAGSPLIQQKGNEATTTEAMFTDSNRNSFTDFAPAFMYDTNGNAKIYPSTKAQVYFYDTKVTIAQLVDTVNKHSAKIFIDTVYMWPKRPANIPAGARIDSNYLYMVYGPPKQFIIKRCKDAEEEKRRKEEIKIAVEQAKANWQPQTLAGQIMKYYNTTAITTLGWLNCDRFYKGPQNSDVELELPITLNKYPLHYFLLFKEFSGLVNGTIQNNNQQQYTLQNLPNDQSVTLLAFIKAEGKIYQCRKDFTVAGNAVIKTVFEEISVAELRKIFGNNVRI